MSIFVGDNKVAGVGNPGRTGKPGESAYEIAKKYGYEGTEEEFADGLIIASETNSKLEAHNEDPESHADLREMIANAGGKANWAINDPEEPGYISNRTHWVEQSSEVCVDNINIVAQQQNENLGMAMAPFSMKIVENKTYSVIWDNQTYECIPYRDPVGQILAIGNGAMAGGLTEGNNEPFFFAEIEDGVIILIFDDGADEHTITVIKNEEKIHYLDPKYIKDMYYETLEIETIFEDLTFADYDSGDAPQCTFIENDVYHVIWNDVLYEGLICWFDGEFNILGNSNDNLPFYIDDDGGNNLYIEANDDSENWTVTILKEKSLINPINPKYIKDMYYETPSKEVIFYSNTFEFNDTNQYSIYNSPMLTEGNTYIVSFLGNIYECVGRNDGFGNIYIGNQEVSPGWGFPEVIESNEPFFFATSSDDNGIISVEDYFGEVTITIKEIQNPVIHHLPSKYIKDMYNEDIDYNVFSTYIDMQSNGFLVDWGQSKYGYMVDELNAGFTLEEGKIYKFPLYGNEAEFIAFKENEYGNIIIGNGAFVADSNEDNGLPFAYGIYEEGDTFHYFIVEDENYQGPISISNTEINITKIPEKYLSILEEKEKDIFNGMVQTDNIYPLSQKEILTGEYFILFNGMLNKVNFIEYTDGASFVETSNYAVETVKNGENVSLSFWSESGNHSLRIFKKQNTIKEEYLSDGIGSGSGNGTADWSQNDPNGAGYIKNRTHYDDRRIVKTEDVTINGAIGPYGLMKIADIPLDFDFSKIVAFTLVSDNGLNIIDEPVEVENYNGCLIAGLFALIDSYDYIGNVIPPEFSDLGLYVGTPYEEGDNVSFYYNFTLESGEIVQLDPKYIKDMYYKTPSTATKIIMDDIRLNFGANGFSATEDIQIDLIEDHIYHVYFYHYGPSKRTETHLKAYSLGDNAVAIGNPALIDGGEDTGEPFIIISTGNQITVIHNYVVDNYYDNEAEIYIIEEGYPEEIHQVKAEYVENMYYDKSDERILVIGKNGEMFEPMLTGQEYIFTTEDGIEFKSTSFIDRYTVPELQFYDEDFNLVMYVRSSSVGCDRPYYSTGWLSSAWPENCTLERISKEIKTVPEKCINIDWNGIDSSIKNRTHFAYYEDEQGEVIFDGILSDPYKNGIIALNTDHIYLGKKYLIVFEGEEYICKARQYPSDYRGPELGNMNINHRYWGPNEERQKYDTGEPFLIASDWGTMSLFVDQNYIKYQYSLKIVELIEKEKIHQLEPKYVKDMYGEEYETSLILSEIELTAIGNEIDDHPDWAPLNETPFYFAEGEYFVKVNGVEYECYSTLEGVLLDVNTNNPIFPIVMMSGIYGFGPYIKNGYSCNLELRQKHNKIIHKINHKYVPTDALILRDQVTGYENIITLHNGELRMTCKCDHLKMIQMPQKTEYMLGEPVDLSNLIVAAVCQNGDEKIITNYLYPEYIESETNSIEIKYIECDSEYTILVPIEVNPFDISILQDFDYIVNDNNTYTLTEWKGTYNGEPSTEIIVPDNALCYIEWGE